MKRNTRLKWDDGMLTIFALLKNSEGLNLSVISRLAFVLEIKKVVSIL